MEERAAVGVIEGQGVKAYKQFKDMPVKDRLHYLSLMIDKPFENIHLFGRIYALTALQAEKRLIEFLQLRKQAVL